MVGYAHPIKGMGIYAYVTLMQGEEPGEDLRKSLVMAVREQIGAFAAPDVIHWAPGDDASPHTTSIMSHVCRYYRVFKLCEELALEIAYRFGLARYKSFERLNTRRIEPRSLWVDWLCDRRETPNNKTAVLCSCHVALVHCVGG